MSEITKVTTPLIPKENLGTRNKPISDQAFDLTDPTKVHRTADEGQIQDQQKDHQAALRDMLSRDMFAPALKSVDHLLQNIQRVVVLLQMGISAAEVAENPEMQQLLESLYLQPEELAQALKQQEGSAILFKGLAFDILRDILGKFPDNPRIQQSVAGLLRTFEANANAENSVKTILHTCQNLLNYLFAEDRAQFSEYLQSLAEILLPEKVEQQQANTGQHAELPQENTAKTADQPPATAHTAVPETAQTEQQTQQTQEIQQPQQAQQTQQAQEPQAAAQQQARGIDQQETAQILKGNLLPLLGEIVVKYNQNERIRDMVMVVVHNVVRVDQGSTESLQEAISKLISELRQVATLPEDFEQQLTKAVFASREQATSAQNETVEKLASLLSEALSSSSSSPAALRQSENLLLSLLQNQSAVMDVLHFVLPVQTDQGKMFAEIYVDPDSDETVGRSQEKSRKIFLAFETEAAGSFELSFLETNERVDFYMWCPQRLVKLMGAMKRQIGDLMQMHGYSMHSFQVTELIESQSVADVFPKLTKRRMGIDVRI